MKWVSFVRLLYDHINAAQGDYSKQRLVLLVSSAVVRVRREYRLSIISTKSDQTKQTIECNRAKSKRCGVTRNLTSSFDVTPQGGQ